MYVFEMTALKEIQEVIDGSFDVSKLDLQQTLSLLLVMNQANHKMVLRVADELDALASA